MQSIFTPPLIQFSGTNARIKWISDKMRPFIAKPILIILIPWIVYPTLDIISTHYLNLDSSGLYYAAITTVIGFLSSCIYFFYFFPSILYSKNPFPILGLSVCAIFGLSVLRYFLFLAFDIETHPPGVFAIYELLRQWVFFLVTFTAWGFYALIRALQEKHRTDIKFDRLKIVHNKAQLSPHFTLNLIGDISAKSLKYSPELFEDLNHFITILRYGYNNKEEFNSLAAEIDALFSYLHGQKLRFQDSFFVQDHIDRDLLNWDQLYMPKLLLITLIENIFKHGIFQDAEFPVVITAKMESGNERTPVFYFSTKNKINASLKLKKSEFGIETVRNLLDYYFQNTELRINTENAVFSLTLTIPYEDSNQTWPNR